MMPVTMTAGINAYEIYPAEAFEEEMIAKEGYIEQLEAAPFWKKD